MAFNPPISGWTAASIVPNPNLFGQANAAIDGVSTVQPVASPIPQAQPVTRGYQALRNAIMPTATMPTPQQQQQLTSPSPLQAVAAVSKQLEQSPWTPKPVAQPQNFVNNQTGETQSQPAMPQSKFATSGWTASLPKSSLPTV